ncbi:hypothetical protein [Halobacillus sp. Nhm2S1]|nr:hypothetical protein [Halobacillus sp. Nhm2S1]MBX0356932.1 hypothetical protein [Halobacillus sp. Nhm2S1]
MENTPFHYDGRSAVNQEGVPHEEFAITDEARKNIAANPYLHEVTAEKE